MKRNLKWSLLLFVSLLSYQANAARYYVDASRPDNSGDGLSWGTAKKDLQAAIDAAVNTTDEIWVKNGTYKPTLAPDGTTSDADIRLRTFTFKPLSIYGGFAGTETMLSQRVLNINACKLSGAVGTLGDNCYNVGIYVNTSQMLVLDGFTIEGGISSSTSATRSPAAFNTINISYGAGLNITGWVTLRNLIFRNNSSSSGRGGALYMSGYVLNGTREITRCAFVGNSSASGGAINFEAASSNDVIISNSLFHGNICTGINGGGAIFAYASNLRLVNNTFVNNQASNASANGGAILFRLGTQYSLYNNVFKGNSTATGGGTGVGCDIASPGFQIPTVDAQNNFLQGQASNYDTASDPNGEIVVGTGNLFAQFLALVDANTPYGADGQIFTADDGCQLNGSNNLCANSNLINALVPTIDARGLNRVCFADMGAYENQYEINTPPTVACNGGNACLGGGFLFVPTGANIYNYDKQTGPLTWTNVATAQNNYLASPNDTTNYRIIGIDVEGCRDTAYATVTVSYPDVEVEFTDVDCYGQNTGEITLTPYVGSATPFTYAWSDDPNETGNTRGGLVEGTYDVTMTDANGCIGMETVIISQPSSPLTVSVTGVNNNYCYGAENGGVNLYATGGTTSWPVEYIYSSSANTNTSVGAGGYLNGLMAGNYTAYVTDINGCTASVPFSVTSPAQIVSSFNAVAFNTYSWNGQNYTASGTYEQVFIAISSGEAECDSTVTLNLIITTVAGDQDGNGEINGNEISGDTNGNGMIDGNETTGDTNGDGTIGSGEISGDTNGNGMIDGNETTGDTNGDGTIGSGEISGDTNGNGMIDGNETTGDTNGDGTIGSGEISGDTNGNGTIDNGEIAGDTNGDGIVTDPEIVGDTNGNGVIDNGEIAGDANGNGVIDSGELASLFEQPTLKVSIAPNPTAGEISVKFNASKALVTIKDVNGKFVYSTTLLSGDVLNFEAYKAGVYFVEVNSDFGTKIERIVKQ